MLAICSEVGNGSQVRYFPIQVIQKIEVTSSYFDATLQDHLLKKYETLVLLIHRRFHIKAIRRATNGDPQVVFGPVTRKVIPA